MGKNHPLWKRGLGVCACVVFMASMGLVHAQTTWDGDGEPFNTWINDENWNNNIAPTSGTGASLTITSFPITATSITLGTNSFSIGRLTFGGGGTAATLGDSTETLILTSTTTTAGTGTALWNANTADNVAATVNLNILLQAGSAGSYTGHFRENANSDGGTTFNGRFTQGAGENWTLRFSQASARGVFRFNNTSNQIYEIRNDGTTVQGLRAGAFGNAILTLNGGTTVFGSTGNNFFDAGNQASNAITVVGNNSTIRADNSLALTGTLNQGTFGLRYAAASGPQYIRPEYSSVTGTGTTTVASQASVAFVSNAHFSSGSLILDGSGVLVLGGGDVATWNQFTTARTWNGSGGANTWRLQSGGGFAARGADLNIVGGTGGMTTATFDQSWTLGSLAAVNGTFVATNNVIIGQDTVLTSGAQRNWSIAGIGTIKSPTNWIVGGTMHDFAGNITGTNLRIMIKAVARDGVNSGILRLSGSNNFSGTSSIVIGGNRGGYTHPVTGQVFTTDNSFDSGGTTVVVANDNAFGGVTDVTISAISSDSGTVGSLLLFETNSTRNLTVENNTTTRAAGFGSYSGTPVYTGTATLINSGSIIYLHAQKDSTFTLGSGSTSAVFQNNRTLTGSSPYLFNKGGAGTLVLSNVDYATTNANAVRWTAYSGAIRETGTTGGTNDFNNLDGFNLALGGGVLELGGRNYTNALGTNAGQINLALPGGGGFAAFGADRTVNLGGSGGTVTWNAAGFFVTNNAPLIFGSETANATVTFVNGINLNGGVREIRVNDNPNSTADRAVISGTVSGTGSSGINKTGTGTLVLSGANTYAGTTTVNAGTLVASNNTALGSTAAGTTVNTGGTLVVAAGINIGSENVTVSGGELKNNGTVNSLTFSSGTLSGSGLYNVAVSVGANQILSPGNSPGTLSGTSMTWAPSGTYIWEINDFAGTQGADPGWDFVNLSGSLSITATVANKFIIDITSLDIFNAPGLADNFNNTSNYTLTILTAAGGITGFNANVFDLVTTNFANNMGGGTWGIEQSGNNVNLVFTAVIPEPSTYALFGLGVLGLIVARRLRKKSA